EPQIGQIKLIHKYVDHTDRIVFANPIFKTFREQCALVAVRSLNKALHFRSLRKPRRNHNPRITSFSAFLHNQDPKPTSARSRSRSAAISPPGRGVCYCYEARAWGRRASTQNN